MTSNCSIFFDFVAVLTTEYDLLQHISFYEMVVFTMH